MSIDIYHKFCLSNFDAPAKIDSIQGKAMKSILSYLKTLCKQKGDDSQESILNALKYIFKNWKNLEWLQEAPRPATQSCSVMCKATPHQGLNPIGGVKPTPLSSPRLPGKPVAAAAARRSSILLASSYKVQY